MLYTLAVRVFPGVLLVWASALRPIRALISDDLPTFERPRKAISGSAGSTWKSAAGKLPTKETVLRPLS
jgi:hypothetical protein